MKGTVLYTQRTHDNETTRGWFRNLSQHDRNFAKAYIGCEGKHETAAVWSPDPRSHVQRSEPLCDPGTGLSLPWK